jgi:diguanylate cyclase (GGDEF)-like protein
LNHDNGATALPQRHRWWSHAPELYVLFPVLGLLILALIWGGMFYVVSVERAAAQSAAMGFTRELAETYEAQVVRALREIDQALKVVSYAHERAGQPQVLQELKARSLLPPDLLFSVSIADPQGRVVAATRPAAASDLAGQAVFERQRSADELFIDRPRPGRAAGEWTLRFSRRLQAAGGGFGGVVVIEVDAAYFVSGYDTHRMGAQGLLGLLGTDGVFRARRSGETVMAGDSADHAALVAAAGAADSPAVQLSGAVDGVRRYLSVRQLYDFPLAVVVGLSEDEQLAPIRDEAGTHVWQAVIGSVLVVGVMAILGRLSWQLALSRRRAAEEQIAHAERVEYLAYHDGLTTLPNRSLFSKLLNQNIQQARRQNTQLSVLFLDLDRFKHINDTLGHEAGDQLLVEVAKRLQGCLRASDTVARLGGDEFVAVLPELAGTQGAAVVAQKILVAVARPFVLLDQEFRITVSIGISTYPQDGEDEQTLTKNADVAMYQAKADGKNNFRFYSQALNTNTLERLNLEAGLRRALERDEFELHYQAKQDVRSGRITGMEVLLRWQHPDLGTVGPMHFIPLAEESGLIVLIGKWVLRTACRQNMAWQRMGLPRLSMAVNVSPRQFADENMLKDIKEILAETGMEASLLELEISESLLMGKSDKTLRLLQTLKDLGVQIAIDDFGSGYASLARLREFPLDAIKIDRSFIRELADGQQDHELTRTIIAVGKSLSLKVVAQGVETKGQADYLRDNACDELQGFYLNRPMQAEQVAELLRRDEP